MRWIWVLWVAVVDGVRLVSNNPLTLLEPSTAEEVSHEFRSFPFVCLQGTQLPWQNGRPDVMSTRLAHYQHLSWGYGRDRQSNKSCGCSTFYWRLVKVFSPRAALRGRAAAARFGRQEGDNLVICAYFPVGVTAAFMAAHEATVVFVEECMRNCPLRCTPFLAMDLKDGWGLQDVGGAWVVGTGDVIGGCEPACGHYAGTASRRLCTRWDWKACNTFFPGQTFWGPSGAITRPDAVAGSSVLFEHIRRCGPLYKAGERLQYIYTQARRDHLPIDMEVFVRQFCRRQEVSRERTLSRVAMYDGDVTSLMQGGLSERHAVVMARSILAGRTAVRSRSDRGPPPRRSRHHVLGMSFFHLPVGYEALLYGIQLSVAHLGTVPPRQVLVEWGARTALVLLAQAVTRYSSYLTAADGIRALIAVSMTSSVAGASRGRLLQGLILGLYATTPVEGLIMKTNSDCARALDRTWALAGRESRGRGAARGDGAAEGCSRRLDVGSGEATRMEGRCVGCGVGPS